MALITHDENYTQMLSLLETQLDNFPNLDLLLTRQNITSSSLFLPQVIKIIDDIFSKNENYLYDCLNLLDVTNIFSLIVYNDPNVFFNKLVESIAHLRTVKVNEYIINNDYLSDFIFSSKEDVEKFLDANKYLVAIYLYSTLKTIFYTD